MPDIDDPERADDLTRDALAVLGWARTRALLNRHEWDGEKTDLKTRFGWGRPEWSGFAKRALETWRQRSPSSPNPAPQAVA